jgi:hypothetical protein
MIWDQVGAQVATAVVVLSEKSKKSLVGDGTYIGFVDAVLKEVQNARPFNANNLFDWLSQYLIYEQKESVVLKRAVNIMPGDVVVFQDATLKGFKGLQRYTQNVGLNGRPFFGVIGELEMKKSKLRVYQANNKVGQQVRFPFFFGAYD